MKLTLPVTALGCFSVSVSLGCGQTVAVPPRLLDAKAAATVAPQLAPANANLVIITLSSDEVAESRIRGELQIEGPAARIDALKFEPSHDARLVSGLSHLHRLHGKTAPQLTGELRHDERTGRNLIRWTP